MKLKKKIKYISNGGAKEKKIIFGIQGGKGSFNHEAILEYIKKNKIKNYEIQHLLTTNKVLDCLSKNHINYGLFAICNSIGGIVDESIEAIVKYTFKIEEKITMPIRHFLMKHRQIDWKNVKQILTHPQVIKQCRQTLNEKYSYCEVSSGKNNLIGHAEVAKRIWQGKLCKNIAVIGPKQLAQLYNLDIVDKDLQDNKKNLTTFLLVSNS